METSSIFSPFFFFFALQFQSFGNYHTGIGITVPLIGSTDEFLFVLPFPPWNAFRPWLATTELPVSTFDLLYTTPTVAYHYYFNILPLCRFRFIILF